MWAVAGMTLHGGAATPGRRGAGAVKVLAPWQEFDRVIAGRHVGFVAVGFVQHLAQQFRRYRRDIHRSEEHTSELQSLMRISYAVFCLKKQNTTTTLTQN